MSARDFASSHRHQLSALPPIDTRVNSDSEYTSRLAEPVLSTANTPPFNADPPRQRKRGFSLRTQLFNRTIEQQSARTPIEMSENINSFIPTPSYSPYEPSRSPVAEEDQENQHVDNFHGQKTIDAIDSRTYTSAGMSFINLPNYSSWASTRLFDTGFKGKFDKVSEGFKNFLFGTKKIHPSKNGRCIPFDLLSTSAFSLVDERTSRSYVSNVIVSSVYNRYNAVPLLLFAQFSKLANVYFLVVSVLQIVPNFSTTGTYNSLITFLFFTAIAMAREGFDDWQRHRQDKAENNKEALVAEVDCSNVTERLVKWKKTAWKDIKVGDIVKLSRNDWVPCDLILFHGDGLGDVAYVETAALDGETNLKNKIALPCLREMANEDNDLAGEDSIADFVIEDPNTDLYNFDGNVTVKRTKYSLTNDHVIYRGSILRNTNRAIGMVIFTGQETKIRMNAQQAPRVKAPKLQGRINKIIIFMVFFVVFLAAFCTVAERVWVSTNNSNDHLPWYLPSDGIALAPLLMSFIIMYNTLIPLSLYVSMEIVKLGQRVMLTWDVDMYYEPTNTPCEAHTSSINEELGQISYVFSDKTGTLTDNIMVFRKITVAGHAWLHDLDIQNEFLKDEIKKIKDEPRRYRTSGLSHNHARASTSFEGQSKFGTKAHVRSKSLIQPSTAGMSGAFRRAQTLETELERKSSSRKNSAVSVAASSPTQWKSSAYGPPSATPSTAHEQPTFRRSSLELLQYLQLRPNTNFSRSARLFLMTIAICHACIPDKSGEEVADEEEIEEMDEDSKIKYQAASPDEIALVTAARDLGFVVVDRQFQTVTVKSYPHGFDETPAIDVYEILHTIEFSSNRKRMSVVVRFPDGRICLICKGADSVVFERLRSYKLAESKKAEVQRRVILRKNTEANRAIAARDSMAIERSGDSVSAGPSSARPSFSLGRPSLNIKRKETLGHLDDFLKHAQAREAGTDVLQTPRMSVDIDLASASNAMNFHSMTYGENVPEAARNAITQSAFLDALVDESIVTDTATVFENTLSHIDEFATEGLRTLVYAHKFMTDDEFKHWDKIYTDAITSLDNRAQKIESAGELVENDLELCGATAIEDKLQVGVPEAIDKLRRAGIKLWMLTGDKRETAISIGHSCRLIHDYSTVMILQSQDPDMASKMAAAMLELESGNIAHCVVVVDGGTLTIIEKDMTLMTLFVDLGVKADSVICCRASPSQKALLVTAVRSKVKTAVTLAVGDGANDIAMIQAADVGIGIAGKEGLQASRSSDFSVGQFRFLLKLLLVHGRWNYVRLSKYVLSTFYKEFFFYLTQAMFQRFTMYSGSSLYESISLTMYNTLFTSLPVLCLGIFMQDLSPETLVAVPELYSTSRLNKHFNLRIFVGWMAVASSQAVLVTFTMFYVYAIMWPRDNGLYPMGTLNFAAIIFAIAVKLNFVEMHNRTILSFASLIISECGWFLWTLFLTEIYPDKITKYIVKDSLIKTFGPDATWWATFFLACGVAVVFDLALVALRCAIFPSDTDIFEEIEKDELLRARLEQDAILELSNSWEGDERHKKRQQLMQKKAAELRSDSTDEYEIQEILRRRADDMSHRYSSGRTNNGRQSFASEWSAQIGNTPTATSAAGIGKVRFSSELS
ncbi:hypothetical protein V1514DRAFT_280325 [Lipomyces japonicus]|uniref:uncharacterized protein n=1 Tax=Lipomyces japonicus TaxID=56871 RepID=UPI0034CD241C